MTESRAAVTWRRGGAQDAELHRSTREGMDMFIILIVVRVSQMTCQIYQIMHFKYVTLLYANYNTIKLFVKSVHPPKTWPFKSTFPPNPKNCFSYSVSHVMATQTFQLLRPSTLNITFSYFKIKMFTEFINIHWKHISLKTQWNTALRNF